MRYYFNNLLLLIGFLCVQPFNSLKAQANAAAFISGDFADPSIIKVKNRYYAVGTSSEWAPHFPIYASDNLRDWKQLGYVFDKAPEWTSGSFWAPEYYFHNNTYYIYYTARRKADNVSCVGVATSKYPDRGFKDQGVIISFGKEAIDGFVYNDNGQLYITFKAYGLDKRPIEILGSKLSADGLKLEGEVFSMLKDSNRMGMEGQSILHKDGFYYLFYSSGDCCGKGCSYNVRVARSKDFKGPYEEYSGNPILQTNEGWKCPGHGTFVQQEDGRYMYIYHAYNKQSNVFTGREGMLAELVWGNGGSWPSFVSKQAGNRSTGNITASFEGQKIAPYWQWDFRNTTPVIRQNKGKLYLSGTVKEGNNTGVVLTVRPVSNHFDMTTTVANSNAALKGLAFYGDANAAIGIGAANDKVEFWMIKDNIRTVLATQNIKTGVPVQLRFTIKPDLTCEVFYRQEGSEWQQVAPEIKQDVSFLPQWDRSPRAGLHFKGEAGLEAEFTSFEVVNK
ncbi:glycoside hydrolase family 43 protein [Chitinophaga filiformis]|uniref:glycoside hydrolase family 43 protein n=1 Tax=Chitinophaga filiformis TaxID=104663 RepID=UPI001F34ED06|nr:glycoside hydrolase family 43 protein [Chitinophaga filiformis]MCF6404634.1 glycoside hydrolase family 43 protein [Chitinophaga filiformis]